MIREKACDAYNEIFEVIEKHKDLCIFDINGLRIESELHLFALRIIEDFGLEIRPNTIRSLSYNRINEYISIGMWGEKYKRTISWSDDNRQPDDELLLEISFPTGAYIFGQDYPKELFSKFFNELKSYNPKYTDTTNKNLYFSMDNAKDVFNDFDSIYKKYREMNKEESIKRKIENLESELEKLKKS